MVDEVVAMDTLNVLQGCVLDVDLALINKGGKLLFVNFTTGQRIAGVSGSSWHWARSKIMAGVRVVSC